MSYNVNTGKEFKFHSPVFSSDSGGHQNVTDLSIKSVTTLIYHLHWSALILLYSIQSGDGLVNFENVQF